ncbi:MAG: hypothetical protein AAF598_22470 [Bacteroidota bacterium]
MKNVSLLLLIISVIGLSSCSARRGCNGNWYNNRNVQNYEFPKPDAQLNTDTHAMATKADDDEC